MSPSNLAAALPITPENALTIAASPEHSVWVNASAGTGKTNILTRRVLSLLLHGNHPSRILCLTYTKAAAAEMAERIHAQLGGWISLDRRDLVEKLSEIVGRAEVTDAMVRRARTLFAECLEVPDGLKVQTLHGFCQSILQRFPLEAGLIPHFQVAEERRAADLLQQSIKEILLRVKAGEPIAQSLEQLSLLLSGEDSLQQLLQKILGKKHILQRGIDQYGGLDTILQQTAHALEINPQEKTEQIVARICGECDETALRQAADAMLRAGTASEIKDATELMGWLQSDPTLRAEKFEEYSGLFLTKDQTVRKKISNQKSNALWSGTEPALQQEADRILKSIEIIKRQELFEYTRSALIVAQAIFEEYVWQKKRIAALDYDDLISYTLRLLQKPDMAPWVLFKLDGGIDHLLVDEAQDTSLEQWQIIQLLTEEFFAGEGMKKGVSTIFVVGDPKQSIFSFQRADPRALAKMQSYFRDRIFDARQELQIVPLSYSYRSVPAVLEMVDSVFSLGEAKPGVLYFEESTGAKLSVTGEDVLRHVAKRQDAPGLVEIWPVAEKEKSDDAKPWQIPNQRIDTLDAESKLAETIADTIQQWLQRGEMLAANPYARRDKARPIEPGDIMILLRRRHKKFVAAITRALKRRNIPLAGVDRLILSQHIAVMDLTSLGKFLLLPEDDLNLASVLKSPLLQWPADRAEELLFALSYNRGETSLWQKLQERRNDDPIYAKSYDYLLSLYNKVDRLKPFELYSEVLGPLGGRKAMEARLGHECLDPIDEFLNLTLAVGQHTQSLQEFIDWLSLDETEIKRDQNRGRPTEVRIMTVHASKGLQAPIVFLPDTTGLPHTDNRLQDLLADEDRHILLWPPYKAAIQGMYAEYLYENTKAKAAEEYRRLLYVALTRAEDRLYIAGYGSVKDNSWYDLIHKSAMAMLSDNRAQPITLDFPQQQWGGNGFRIGASPLAQFVKNIAPVKLPARLPDWLQAPIASEYKPLQVLIPSHPLLTEPASTSPIISNAYGQQRGRIIHRLLQSLPETDPDSWRQAAERYLAQPVLNLTAEEQADISRETLHLISNPVFRDYFGPNSRAEVPLSGHIGDYVVHAQIDRLVLLPDKVKILDYKTNRPIPQNIGDVPEVYLRQMASYQALVERIYPQKTVETALLWTAKPLLMPLPADILAKYRP